MFATPLPLSAHHEYGHIGSSPRKAGSKVGCILREVDDVTSVDQLPTLEMIHTQNGAAFVDDISPACVRRQNSTGTSPGSMFLAAEKGFELPLSFRHLRHLDSNGNMLSPAHFSFCEDIWD